VNIFTNAANVNRYIDNIQLQIKEGITIPKKELYEITLDTQPLRYAKLSTFIRATLRIVPNREVRMRIRSFFMGKYLIDYYEVNMEAIMKYDGLNIIKLIKSNLLCFLVNLQVISELERDIMEDKNMVIRLGFDHIERIIEYIKYTYKSNIHTCKVILEY
jgi:hypothetical protein